MPENIRLNLGGTDAPGFPNNQYCIMSYATVAEGVATLYDPARKCLVAPCDGVLEADWQTWIAAQAAQYGDGLNGQFVAKLIKNCTVNTDGTPNYGTTGLDVFASIGTPCCQPGTAITGGGVSDTCAKGDTYSLFLWASAGVGYATVTVDGNPAHTQLSATFHPSHP
jgi:hypothetical protein